VTALHRVLGEHGLEPAGGAPLYGEWSQRWGRHAARMLLATDPEVDAVFCGNDQIATGVADTLSHLGKRIPEDVAIVGYDNWEEFAADCRPPLTTVDLDLERLGTTAARYLSAPPAGPMTYGEDHRLGVHTRSRTSDVVLAKAFHRWKQIRSWPGSAVV
jgi:LacI family transcriptional regulator